MTYTITLTKNQCFVLQNALDFYYRIAMGQLGEIKHVAIPKPNYKADYGYVESILALLSMVLLGWESYGINHGIASPHMPDDYKVACDLHDVLRQRLAIDELKPGKKPFGVAFDPIMKKGKEPLAKIKKVFGRTRPRRITRMSN